MPSNAFQLALVPGKDTMFHIPVNTASPKKGQPIRPKALAMLDTASGLVFFSAGTIAATTI